MRKKRMENTPDEYAPPALPDNLPDVSYINQKNGRRKILGDKDRTITNN